MATTTTIDDADALDSETVQAHVDISMSIAQNLVYGWMKSATKGKLARVHHDTEREIEEQMQRPPRLGVGAAVPASEAGTSYRDTARLKGALTGGKAAKKRAREEEHDAKLQQAPDSDDESRAGAIKKKQKLDPYAPKPKKAKNTVAVVNPPVDMPPSVEPPPLSKRQRRRLAAAKAEAEATGVAVPGPVLLQEDTVVPESVEVDVATVPSSPAKAIPSLQIPILNLDGTFPELDDSTNANKKKRKRRKKNKTADS